MKTFSVLTLSAAALLAPLAASAQSQNMGDPMAPTLQMQSSPDAASVHQDAVYAAQHSSAGKESPGQSLGMAALPTPRDPAAVRAEALYAAQNSSAGKESRAQSIGMAAQPDAGDAAAVRAGAVYAAHHSSEGSESPSQSLSLAPSHS
jgi:hypothetical protein